MAYLGIDLGTTNTVGVIYDDRLDALELVKIDGIEDVLPSVVTILEDEVMVGNEAKDSGMIYPETTVLSIKRQMGEDFSMHFFGRDYRPEDISGIILRTIKEAAQVQSEDIFDEVVITHPAYFNDRQIFATQKAGELAGFTKVHLLSEPLASAIEYGYKQGYAQTLLVYDLGGGTFDACVLKVNKDLKGQETFQELSDVGDMPLGGDDFDQMLIDYMIEQFRLMTNVQIQDLPPEERARIHHKLKREAEQVKHKLSSTNKASVKVSPLMIQDGVPLNLTIDVSKDDFEALIRPLIERSRVIVAEALTRAEMTADDISKVILVGGSTLVPMVKRMISGYIKEPYRASDPAKSVAMGAAIYNYLMHLPDSYVSVGQITRQHFGTEAIMSRTTGDKALVPIIPMGSQIPVSITDDQFGITAGASALRVDVFQWEEGHEKEKKYTGSLMLEGIDMSAKIAVTYAIDENNLFQVVVEDTITGKKSTGAFDRKVTMPPLPEMTTSGDGTGINVSFIIDTTGSMDRYIDGVKERAMAFADILHHREIAFNLGLIGFGDLLEKEKPKVYKWTRDVGKFQKQVRKIPRTCGGDIPESAIDALETGLLSLAKVKGAENYKNIMILITDAPPHLPTVSGLQIDEVVAQLQEKDVTVYVVAKKDRKSIEAYEPLTALGGHYYSMEEDFNDILDKIAYSIAQLVRL